MTARVRRLATAGNIQDVAQDALGFLFGSGALAVALSCLIDPRPEMWGAIIPILLAASTSAVVMLDSVRVPDAVLQVLLGFGTSLVTTVAWSSGSPVNTDLLIYVWVTAYAGFFYSSLVLALQMIWIALSFGTLLVFFAPSLHPQAVVAQVVFTTVAAGVAGVWTHLLRKYLDFLMHRVQRTAAKDSLTAVFNRAELARRGELLMREGTELAALILLDVRNFQVINDRVGPENGDKILRSIAGGLREWAPDSLVARIDGDEFAVLATSRDLPAVEGLVRELTQGVTSFDAEQVQISLTCGAAPVAGRDGFATLLRDADLALQHARTLAKGRLDRLTWAWFEESMRERVLERQALIRDLHEALAGDELELHFQPLVDLGTGRVIAAEALARWRHPQRGFVRPDLFIPLAEESGHIVALGDWVLRTALDQARRWTEISAAPPFVSINLSPRQLADPQLVESVTRYAAEAGIAPDRVMLEITETAVMADVTTARARLATLRGHGFRVAVDDFGTGHSSLAYLRDLPVTELKVAREFVNDIPGAPETVGLCSSIIQLAHNLGLGVVAEGIETAEQYRCLQDLGADIGQGYLMHRPMPADDLAALVVSTSDDGGADLPGQRRVREGAGYPQV